MRERVNLSKDGVTAWQIRKSGGPAVEEGQVVTVWYKLKPEDANAWAIDCWDDNRGFKFRFGNREVIPGLEIGMEGMGVADMREIHIPSHLAFGSLGYKNVIAGDKGIVVDVYISSIERQEG